MEQKEEYNTQQEVDEAMEMLGKGYDNYVKDEGPHDFYCQIPNMVDDFGLSPLAYRLYGHLRRVAGENGKCWQNTRTLAKACDMSEGSISNAKKELIETEFIPFIRVKKIPTKTGFSYDEITLTDLWQLNHDVYSKETVHQVNRSPHERLVHQVKQRITLIKKNSKIQEEEKSQPKNIFSIYQEEIGLLTPLIADALEDWEKSVPEKWIMDAIGEAVKSNARNWKYIEAILKRWKAQGNQEQMKAVRANGKQTTPAEPKAFEAIRQFMAEQGE